MSQMGATATVRVMSPEEIAARAGGQTPFLLWPERATLFAEREMRLRQLARGHAMEDFLAFMAELAHAQQGALADFPSVPLPDGAALDRAAKMGVPPLPAVDWPRDPAWRAALRSMLGGLRDRAPQAAREVLDRLVHADDDWLESQADCLLTGVMQGLDLAAAPLVAAALQVYWTHLVLAVQAASTAGGQPFGRIDDETVCPCCGSRPVASITRTSGESLGQRYLTCSLCATQWHMVRIKCSHCLSTKSLAYQALQDAKAEGTEGVASAAVQAETCDDCGHYLKIVHTDRDPMVEAVADDLATLTLDLLVSETGKRRHGVNLMLLFGEPGPEDAPPDPGQA
jgi:FdhE protein